MVGNIHAILRTGLESQLNSLTVIPLKFNVVFHLGGPSA